MTKGSVGSKPPRANQESKFSLIRNRLQLLRKISELTESPMVLLGLVWFFLMVIDLTRGLGATGENITTLIWIVFVVDFALRLVLAPRKLAYLRQNWLTVIALILPALRMVRFLRLLRVRSTSRGLTLVRILASIKHGMHSLGETMERRGFGYVLATTCVVTVAGAAGMLHFEGSVLVEDGIDDFWTALWWTGMIMTTMGSEYWPRTVEGRVLCIFLAIYAFAVFGYVTGTIATYFIGHDYAQGHDQATLQALRVLTAEVSELRNELARHNGAGS